MRRLGTLPLMHQPGERWMYNTGVRRAGRADRARRRPAAGDVPAGAHLRAARHEGHRLQRAGRRSSTGWPPATGPTPKPAALARLRRAARSGRGAARPPSRPAAAGLVSTVDDYLAFGQMLLNQGRHGSERILSRPSVEADDDRPAHARAEGGLGLVPRLLGQPRLGLRRVRRHPARRRGRDRRAASAGTAASAPPGRPIRRRTWSAS